MGSAASQINKALSLFEGGNYTKARKLALKITSQDPSHATAWNILGVIAASRDNYLEAKQAFSRLAELKPDFSIAWANIARACFQLGEFPEASSSILKAITIEPSQTTFYDILILVAREQELELAHAALNSGIGLLLNGISGEPNNPPMLIALHKLWVANSNIEQAVSSGLLAIASDPGNQDLKVSFAGFLFRHSRVSQAAKLYAEIVEADPQCSEGWLGFGACHHEMSSMSIAREAYERAISLDPYCVGANKNLGTLLAYGREFELAIEKMEKVLSIQPDAIGAKLQLMAYQRNICNWKSSEDCDFESTLLSHQGNDVSPFQALPFFDSPELQLSLAKNWRSAQTNVRARLDHLRVDNRRIRVGWFGSDFHDHATMFLLAAVFREYNKELFEFYVYSYGANKRGDYRERLIGQVDTFRCFAHQNDEAIIKAAREDSLDLAVDLKGFTNGGRYHVFAHGVAPVQITYLGYPGTSGSDHFDYLLADNFVVPEAYRQHYSEAMMFMPNCYQPNDDQREISDRIFQRHLAGLPSSGVVFASFNQSYKISPREFNLWGRLLNSVPESVLWLYVENETAKKNLASEMLARGVSPERLVFAERLENAEHLARCKLADIFLDCFNVNAHTTASDALWAGVPVVTLPGRQFAARVAGSILCAANLSEFIASTEQEYFDIAIDLATDSHKLRKAKEKVAKARATSPLFDSKQYTRDLESLFATAFSASLGKENPQDISIN